LDHKKMQNGKFELVVSGGTAGIVAKTCCAPLERIKLLNQLGQTRGLLPTLRIVFQTEGVKGFWRGNGTNCLRVFPHKGILFASNEFYKSALRLMFNGNSSATLNATGFAAGSLAGVTAVIVTYPLDLARTRIAGTVGNDSRYTTIRRALKLTWKEEGPSALYRGIGPTLFGAVCFEGLKFGAYDFFLRKLGTKLGREDLHLGWKLSAGAVAGLCAHLCIFPNDTVRRRMQLQGIDGMRREYKNALHCYYRLYKEGGLGVFYRGFSTNILRSVPNTAIQFGTFEVLKSFFFANLRTTSWNPSD